MKAIKRVKTIVSTVKFQNQNKMNTAEVILLTRINLILKRKKKENHHVSTVLLNSNLGVPLFSIKPTSLSEIF